MCVCVQVQLAAAAGSLWRAATMADPGYTPNYGTGAPGNATPTHPYVPALATARDVDCIVIS